MQLNLKKRNIIRTKDAHGNQVETNVKKYENKKSLIDGMNLCLDCIHRIQEDVDGINLNVFLDNEPIIERCAINYIVIGNQIGRLDPQLQLNPAMKKAHKERSLIAHSFKEPTFKNSSLWNDIIDNMDGLKTGCEEASGSFPMRKMR